MTILVVENRSASSPALAEILQKRGYPIQTAVDADQGVELFKRHSPWILVYHSRTDLIQGIELFRRVRQIKTRHYLYCILAVKIETQDDIKQALKQGADAVLSVPVDMDYLEAQIGVGIRISRFRMSGAGKPNPLKKEEIGEYDIVFARIAMENQLVTKDQLARAFSFQQKQRQEGKAIALGDIFLKFQMVAPERIQALHGAAKRHLGKKFGVIAIKKGFATREQVELALKVQAREFETRQVYQKTGDILVAHGAITEFQRDLIRQELPRTPVVVDSSSGPFDFDGTNRFQIQVSDDQMRAYLHFLPGGWNKTSSDAILSELERQRIQLLAVDAGEIAQMLDRAGSGENSFLVAQGRPPVHGRDAVIHYQFNIDHLTAGTINSDGNIDYRERGRIPRVMAGELLAVKVPLEASTPGVDVYNAPIPVPEPRDFQLKCGEGARLSEDGLQVFATRDGQPNLAVSGTVSVFAELIIDGDVNFQTGNIDFDGNVTVRGSITDGFTIKCGHLQAKDISGGAIQAMGDVAVTGGIVGADIRTEGNVTARFVSDSNIKSFGSVLVEKQVIDSKIRSSGRFVSQRGKIISSFISAKMGFESRDIGTDVSNPCRINVGMDENVKKRIQGFNFLINDKKIILENAHVRYETALKKQQVLHARIVELAQIQEQLIALDKESSSSDRDLDQCFAEQEALDEQISADLTVIETAIKEIEAISDEKTAVQQWSETEKGDAVMIVHGWITPQTNLFGRYSSMQVKEPLQNVVIREVLQPDGNTWRMTVLNAR